MLAVNNEHLMMQHAMLSHAHAMTMHRMAWERALAMHPCAPMYQHPSKPTSSAASTASGGDVHSEATFSDDSNTTVIMKKIPKAFTRDMLIQLLDRSGYRSKFDFVYIPVDFEKCQGTGCAFVNFLDSETAALFQEQFEGFRSWGVRCSRTKVAEISWSQACQGKQAHIDRYRDSPVMHHTVPDQYKPALFLNGVRIPFPAPTRVLCAPHMPGLM